jgi:hypothetical protein
MEDKKLTDGNGALSESSGAIIPSDLMNELKCGVRKVMEIPPEIARNYSKIVVNIGWIPSVSITFTPKN